MNVRRLRRPWIGGSDNRILKEVEVKLISKLTFFILTVSMLLLLVSPVHAASAPTAVTNAATVVTSNGATLNGTVNPNDDSTTVTFEYGLTASYGTSITADQSPVIGTADTAVSKVLTGLIPNTTYHFRVVAVNTYGTTNGLDQTFSTTAIAPTVTTNAAGSITSSGATLNGTVNANNASTTVTFEYGLTASYGTSITADQSPVTGSTNTAVSKALTGLTPNTIYHFRVVGVNSAGTSNGGDLTFSTTAIAPTVTTNAASSITSSGAILNGTVNANNASTTVTFEYGLTASYGTSITADQSPVIGTTNTAVSKALTGLTPNTIYHFRVVGVNSAGTSNGGDLTFTTTAIAPTVTTNAASSITSSGAILNGTVNANNSSTTVTFDYGLTDVYGSSVTATQSPVAGATNTAVSASLTGLSTNTTYHFRVTAVNGVGTTNGSDQTFTTGALAPVVTTNAASGITSGGATLNGMVNANNASTTVTFQYGLTTSYGTSITADQSPVIGTTDTAVSKALTGLTPNTTYHYRVVGVNSGGTTNGGDLTFTTTAIAPTVTTNAATSITSSGATLNGTVNANNSSTTVTFDYGLTDAYGSSVTATQSPVTGATNTAVSASLTGLMPNTTYHFRVVGVNSAGTTNDGDQTFTTGTLAPTVTTSAASGITSGGATLNGTVNANNSSTTVTFDYGLTISYGSTITATQSPVAGTSNTSVTASLTGLVPNSTYHFRVVGVSGAGTTNGLDQTFTTGTLAPTVTTGAASGITESSATLNGTVNANNASTTVTFEYGLTTSYGSTVTATQSPVTGTSNTSVTAPLTGLTPNATYHFRVVGVNSAGTTNGDDQTFTTTAIAPTVTTNPAGGITSNGAILNGTVNAHNASTTVTFEYGLTDTYGSTITATQSPVTGVNNVVVSASLTGLTPNSTYHFRVVGVNSAGTSGGGDLTFTTTPIAPTVTTNAASGITSSGATLNGTVNANNASTVVTFDYGLTTSYGSSITADQSPVTGATNTAVSRVLTGLIPNTTYHYRAVGVNATGTTSGSDRTFTTTAIVPTVTTGTASSITENTATLNGTVNANNASTTVTFEYGLTDTYGNVVTATQSPVTGATTTPVSAPLTGLVLNTTYHYRVVGVNSVGTSSGADHTFTTSAVIPTVSTSSASGVTATAATLNGTVNARNASTAVSFEYGLTDTYGNVVTAAQSPVTGTSTTAVTASITGLTPNTTYHYRVVGVNSAGEALGNDQIFNTSIIVPVVTTNAASDVTSIGAVLNGTVNANNASTTATFEYGLTTSYGTTLTAEQSPITGTENTAVSIVLTNLTPNSTYHYRAVGTNSAGRVNGSDRSFATSTVVPTVISAVATGVNSRGAVLNGVVNANNASTAVTFEYGLTTSYGTTVAATPGTVTGVSNTPVSVTLTNLTTNVTYHYRLVGVNSAGRTESIDRTFTTSLNSNPTNITLSNSSTNTGRSVNTEVGKLTTTDPDAIDTHTYSLQSGVSGCDGTDNASFNISGAVLRTSVVFVNNGKTEHSICIRTTDNGSPAGSYDKNFIINITPPKLLGSMSDQTVNEGETLNINLNNIVYPNAGSLTFSKIYGPDGAVISGSNFSWVTTEADGKASAYMVAIRATDAYDNSDIVAFNINVKITNQAPQFITEAEKIIGFNESLSFVVNATDPDIPSDGNTLTYSAVSLPPGATFTPDTRTFYWMPSVAVLSLKTLDNQTYNAVFRVTDSGAGALTDEMTVNITLSVPDGLFYDPFDSKLAWGKLTKKGGSAVLQNGYYYMEHKVKNLNYIAIIPKTEPIQTSYEIETSMRTDPDNLKQDPKVTYGIVFDYKSSASTYRFWIQPSTGAWALQYFKGTWKNVAKGTSTVITSDWNTIHIKRWIDPTTKKVMVSVTVNGTELVSNKILKVVIKKGKAGMIVHADSKMPKKYVARVMSEYFAKYAIMP